MVTITKKAVMAHAILMLFLYIFFHTILLYNRANQPTNIPLEKSNIKELKKLNHPIDLGNVEFYEPPKMETCRNSGVARNFDKVIISVPPYNDFGFLNIIPAWKDSVQLKYCDVNCVYTKAWNKNTRYSADAFLSYYTKRVQEKMCPHQKKVLYFMENWKVLKSHFSKFDVIASTHPSSDVYTNYFWYGGPFRLLKLPRKKIRKSIAAAYISNCKVVSSRRMEIIDELRKYGVTIDSYGSCGSNSYEPSGLSNIPRNQRKIENIAYYKFYLAFENSKDPGYITEKYWEALTAGTVPVYLGAPDVKLYAPSPNSMLVVDDFKSIKELAERMIYLANNEHEYNKMLEWKKTGPQDSFLAITDYQAYDIWCKICHKVADRYQIPTHSKAMLVREMNTFRYRPIYLIKYTYEELVLAIQLVYKGYTPRWSHLRSGHDDKDRPLRVYRIFNSDLKYDQAIAGDAIDRDEKVAKLKPGTRLDVIFL